MHHHLPPSRCALAGSWDQERSQDSNPGTLIRDVGVPGKCLNCCAKHQLPDPYFKFRTRRLREPARSHSRKHPRIQNLNQACLIPEPQVPIAHTTSPSPLCQGEGRRPRVQGGERREREHEQQTRQWERGELCPGELALSALQGIAPLAFSLNAQLQGLPSNGPAGGLTQRSWSRGRAPWESLFLKLLTSPLWRGWGTV